MDQAGSKGDARSLVRIWRGFMDLFKVVDGFETRRSFVA